jgi:hypothetical protein
MTAMNKSEKNDPRFVWVTARENGGGDGSRENPFDSVSKAAEFVHPGQTIVLQGGSYRGDATIQKGGTIDKPVRIVAEEGARVEFVASCWFFYDVSDVIFSGIEFRDSPGMALSVVGKCVRNRFELLRFINCSTEKDGACTFFFGGSGQACNTVASCRFERTPDARGRHASVGLMITEGDFQEGDRNSNHIISKNVFSRYDYGVIVGSQDSNAGEYGHQVVYNTFEGCTAEGIMVKCGDTLVKGNIVRGCGRHSISIAAGMGSIVEDNRVVDCGYGIRVAGKGHSVSNNCIVRCREASLCVLSAPSPDTAAASNILIERNTFVGNGDPENSRGIRIEPLTTCIVRGNLFHDTARPYEAGGFAAVNRKDAGAAPFVDEKRCLISDNLVSGACAVLGGCASGEVAFRSAPFDNYMNESGYGASGWMLSPEAYDPGPEVLPEAFCGGTGDGNTKIEGEAPEFAEAATEVPDDAEEAPDELAVRSLFYDADDDDDDEREASALTGQESEDFPDDYEE